MEKGIFVVRSKDREENHMTIFIESNETKKPEKLLKEIRTAIHRQNCRSEKKYSYEIFGKFKP